MGRQSLRSPCLSLQVFAALLFGAPPPVVYQQLLHLPPCQKSSSFTFFFPCFSSLTPNISNLISDINILPSIFFLLFFILTSLSLSLPHLLPGFHYVIKAGFKLEWNPSPVSLLSVGVTVTCHSAQLFFGVRPSSILSPRSLLSSPLGQLMF